jgi:hypothetical protein
VDAGDGDGGFVGAEVAGEVFGRERLALLAEVEQRPNEALGGMAVDLRRLLHLPVTVAEADENEVLAVKADAEERVQRVPVLVLHPAEAALDLLNDLLAAGRVGLGADPGARVGRVLVLDDDAGVDGIHPALGDGKLVLSVQFHAGFLLDEGELLLDLDADFFFLVGQGGGLLHLVGELDGLSGDQLVERLGCRHPRLLAAKV